MESRSDFVIFGASGFTGQFVVEEVGRVVEETPGLKYAVAGRSQKKLEDVLKMAKENTNLDFSNVNIIVADVNDYDSLVSMAKKAKVLINCVGPYRFHGMKVVEACIEGGADYVDISGEPQFLEQVQLKLSEKAEEKGVHIVGSCGFDSIPADMGVVFLQNNFEGDINSVEAVVGLDDESKGSATINVTTLESALHGYAARKELRAIRQDLFKEKMPRSSYRSQSRGVMWWSDEARRWCLPNMATDRSVVMRTQRLNFTHSNTRPIQFNIYFGLNSIAAALAAILFGLVFAVMAPFQFTRDLFVKYPFIFSFGTFSRDGARREDLKGLKFLLTFVAEGWSTTLKNPEEQHTEPPNVKKVVEVSGPDPGYFGTAIMLVQSAMTVRQEKDKLQSKGGVFTPGAAFAKTTLIERLQKKGIVMKVVE